MIEAATWPARPWGQATVQLQAAGDSMSWNLTGVLVTSYIPSIVEPPIAAEQEYTLLLYMPHNGAKCTTPPGQRRVRLPFGLPPPPRPRR
jgi:hypothetical protein